MDNNTSPSLDPAGHGSGIPGTSAPAPAPAPAPTPTQVPAPSPSPAGLTGGQQNDNNLQPRQEQQQPPPPHSLSFVDSRMFDLAQQRGLVGAAGTSMASQSYQQYNQRQPTAASAVGTGASASESALDTTAALATLQGYATATATGPLSTQSTAGAIQQQIQALEALRRQRDDLVAIREKEERVRALREEQERRLRTKKADAAALAASSPSSSTAAGPPEKTSATTAATASSAATDNTNPSESSSAPASGPAPATASAPASASAPAPAVGPPGWFVCTVCNSRAFSSESDLSVHKTECVAAMEKQQLQQQQLREQVEIMEKLNSARAEVAALESAAARQQQQLRSMEAAAAAAAAAGTNTNSSMNSSSGMLMGTAPEAMSNYPAMQQQQQQQQQAASYEIPRDPQQMSSQMYAGIGSVGSSMATATTAIASRSHLDALQLGDVTRLAMQEMERRANTVGTNTVRGLTPPPSQQFAHMEQQQQHRRRHHRQHNTSGASSRAAEAARMSALFAENGHAGTHLDVPTPLGIPLDKDMLTPLHCFVREHCVQIFTATDEEVNAPSKGKRRPILVGQVGIRCPHCKGRPQDAKSHFHLTASLQHHGNSSGPERGSVYYPFTIASIYNATMNLLQRHLPHCPCIPAWTLERYRDLKTDDARSGTSKQYWIHSAQWLGLVDTPAGIRYDPNLVDTSWGGHRQQQGMASSSTSSREVPALGPPSAADRNFYSNQSNAATRTINMDNCMAIGGSSSAMTAQEHAEAAMRAAAAGHFGAPPNKPSPHELTTTAPAAESVRLVEPTDRPLATSFSYYIMSQMQKCRFAEADRLGKRKALPLGYAGLACRHCYGGYGSGRFFPSTLKTLSDTSKTLNVLHNHMMRCRKCPVEVRDSLEKLKCRHDIERARMKFGSQKAFFERIWSRLHDGGRAMTMAPAPQPAAPVMQHMMPMAPPADVIKPSQQQHRAMGPPADNPLAALALLAGMKRKDRAEGDEELAQKRRACHLKLPLW